MHAIFSKIIIRNVTILQKKKNTYFVIIFIIFVCQKINKMQMFQNDSVFTHYNKKYESSS